MMCIPVQPLARKKYIHSHQVATHSKLDYKAYNLSRVSREFF